MFKINDYVTRKSYHHDMVFKIIKIDNNLATLKGFDYRLYANAPLKDLSKYEIREEAKNETLLPIQSKNYLKGKVLHLDSDAQYLKRCMKLYEEYKVPAIGYQLSEKEMPLKIIELLNQHHPDILIITGHDSIDKNGHYLHSKFFIESVKKARIYQPSKDALCIISGACYSAFKELIYEGSNISSSPGKVSIHVLDPAKVAIMVATTPVTNYVEMEKVIDLTSNKEKGMGGIDTKGVARKIY